MCYLLKRHPTGSHLIGDLRSNEVDPKISTRPRVGELGVESELEEGSDDGERDGEGVLSHDSFVSRFGEVGRTDVVEISGPRGRQGRWKANDPRRRPDRDDTFSFVGLFVVPDRK